MKTVVSNTKLAASLAGIACLIAAFIAYPANAQQSGGGIITGVVQGAQGPEASHDLA